MNLQEEIRELLTQFAAAVIRKDRAAPNGMNQTAAAPKKTSRKARALSSAAMRCRHASKKGVRCKKRSRGPRFKYLCADHGN